MLVCTSWKLLYCMPLHEYNIINTSCYCCWALWLFPVWGLLWIKTPWMPSSVAFGGYLFLFLLRAKEGLWLGFNLSFNRTAVFQSAPVHTPTRNAWEYAIIWYCQLFKLAIFVGVCWNLTHFKLLPGCLYISCKMLLLTVLPHFSCSNSDLQEFSLHVDACLCPLPGTVLRLSSASFYLALLPY